MDKINNLRIEQNRTDISNKGKNITEIDDAKLITSIQAWVLRPS